MGDDNTTASPKFKIIKKGLEDIRKDKTQLTQPIGSIEHSKSTTSTLACEFLMYYNVNNRDIFRTYVY